MLILHIFSIFYQAAASHIHRKILRRLFRMRLSHIRRFRPRRMTSSPQSSPTNKKEPRRVPWFFGLVSRVDLFLSGEAGLLEVHASGMNGMYPAFLMAILPSEDGDGDP